MGQQGATAAVRTHTQAGVADEPDRRRKEKPGIQDVTRVTECLVAPFPGTDIPKG